MTSHIASDTTSAKASAMGTPTPLPHTPLPDETSAGGRIIVTAADARAELRRQAESATPGPWLAAVGSGKKRRVQQYALLGIADMRGQGAPGCLAVFAGLNQHRADDAEFTAAARTAVPELLDAIDDVLALCDEWDQLSKGESRTTARIRAAINGRQA